jgi:hypothetical protein
VEYEVKILMTAVVRGGVGGGCCWIYDAVVTMEFAVVWGVERVDLGVVER